MPRFARTTTPNKSGGSKHAREAAEQAAIDNEECRTCYLPYSQHDGREQHRFEGSGRQHDPAARAINEGENRYRQTVLSQGPLPGYPVVAREDAPNVGTSQSEEERRRDQRIRDALVRDRITCPHPKDRVSLYGEAGTLVGEVLYALAFKPSADAWVAEVQYQGAARPRAAIIKRMREGWVEVGEHA